MVWIWGGTILFVLALASLLAVGLGWRIAARHEESVHLRYELRRLQEERVGVSRRVALAEAVKAMAGRGVQPNQVRQLAEEIDRNAQLYDFDPLLILAVVLTESKGHSGAVGRFRSGNSSGALGVMQIKPAAAGEMAERIGLPPPRPEQLLDPSYNLAVGVAYLLRMVHRYRDLRLGIMAYNVGPGGVEAGLRGTNKLPEDYYRKVWTTYRELRRTMVEPKG